MCERYYEEDRPGKKDGSAPTHEDLIALDAAYRGEEDPHSQEGQRRWNRLLAKFKTAAELVALGNLKSRSNPDVFVCPERWRASLKKRTAHLAAIEAKKTAKA